MRTPEKSIFLDELHANKLKIRIPFYKKLIQLF